MPNHPKLVTDGHRLAVKICVSSGIPRSAIARNLGISEVTLEKHYAAELRHGAEDVKLAMTTILVNKAMAGDVSAIKYYLAVRYPEWRQQYNGAPEKDRDQAPVLQFYLPDNGRDQPEDDYGLPSGPPTIEGRAEPPPLVVAEARPVPKEPVPQSWLGVEGKRPRGRPKRVA
jgi:hypothetical protein